MVVRSSRLRWFVKLAVLVGVLISVGTPSVEAAGVTSHSVIAEKARWQMTLSTPDLAAFLYLHRDAFQSGVMFPDASQTYFQCPDTVVENSDSCQDQPDVTSNIDNLTHGNQQGHDGIINRYIQLLIDQCPGDPASGSWECQRRYAFLLGMIAHDVGDSIPHDSFMVAIANQCGFPVESDAEDATAGHGFSDTNVDICLARQLNGNYVNPIVYKPLDDQSAACGQYPGSFSFGAKCYSCPSGYVRLIDLSWADGTIFENASLPVCVKDSGTRCTALPFCEIGTDFAELITLLGCPGDATVFPPILPQNKCHKYSFAWAVEKGNICPSGQSYDLIFNKCVSCPDRYTRNLLALDSDSDYACQAPVNCHLVSVWNAGFIPVTDLQIVNRAAPGILFLGGYDLGEQAWPDDPEFTGQSVFDLGDLKDKVTEIWSTKFVPEHLPLPWEVQIPGIGPVNVAFVDFEGDPTACDWAYTNAFSDEAYLLDAADQVQGMLEALWGELKGGRDVKVKRKGAYKYMVVEDDRIVRAEIHVNGDDDINYSLDMSSSYYGSAWSESANIYCFPPCFEARYVVATPLPGEELVQWRTRTDDGWIDGGDCATGLVYRNEDRECKAIFSRNHPPETTATLIPEPNANGWNNGDVTVVLTAEIWDRHPDLASGEYNMSGAHCEATVFIQPECRATPVVVSASSEEWLSQVVRMEGVSALAFQAKDDMGIEEALKSVEIRIDRTSPTVSVLSPADGEAFLTGWVRESSISCADSDAGIDTCSGTDVGGLIDTSLPGDYVFTATAVDLAGNVRTATAAYRVEQTPEILISDAAETTEGSPGDGMIVTFPVTLTAPISFPVTVVATASSLTADAGDDFVGVTTTLTFAPGETRRDLVVPVIGDFFAEPHESFVVVLSSPVNATIVDGEAVGTIRNDDVAVVPDPAIRVTGCTTVDGPCSLEAYSRSGLAMDGWAFGWYLDGVGMGHEKTSSLPAGLSGVHEIRLVATTLVGEASDTVSITLAPACPDGHLCVQSHAFEIAVDAVDPRTGAAARGVPVVENDLFGYFAFPDLTGSPDNPEVFVKVVDGRAENGNFWFFYGALTDFGLTIRVTDAATGENRVYERAGGSSAGGFDVGGGVTPEECLGEVDGAPRASGVPALCQAADDRLCMLGGRFTVTLSARDHRTGAEAEGAAMPANDLFGYFAIPGLTGSTDNAEVFVKVLDGRGVNGHFWVFYSGLTDLEYTLTVTDGETGETRAYSKDGGSACGGWDTDGF